jgi:hypothetical protein
VISESEVLRLVCKCLEHAQARAAIYPDEETRQKLLVFMCSPPAAPVESVVQECLCPNSIVVSARCPVHGKKPTKVTVEELESAIFKRMGETCSDCENVCGVSNMEHHRMCWANTAAAEAMRLLGGKGQ